MELMPPLALSMRDENRSPISALIRAEIPLHLRKFSANGAEPFVKLLEMLDGVNAALGAIHERREPLTDLGPDPCGDSSSPSEVQCEWRGALREVAGNARWS